MLTRLQSVLSRQRIQFRHGFTFIELLVAMVAGLIILAGMLSTTVFVARSFVAMNNYTDLDKASRNALDVLSRDIRSTASLTSYSSTDIVLTNQFGVQFEYKLNGTTLNRITSSIANSSASTNVTLLIDCDTLAFAIYQRNPSNNFQFVSSSGSPNQTKLIDVSWRCSRTIYGAKINTESVQTARIVIRNNPM